ncbi:hypothetical protein GQ457_02G019510 [Hibiscus cannabinus]
MVTLSGDLISKILSRLSVKDLLHFRCVSKPCCSLIDDLDFIELHLSRSLKTNTHFFPNDLLAVSDRWGCFGAVETLFPFINDVLVHSFYNFSLAFQVCHLIPVDFNSFVRPSMLNHPFSDEAFCTQVLGSCNGLLALHNGEQDIALWNPLKRKFQILPNGGFRKIFQVLVYGFGHDPIFDDYKLVRILQFSGKDGDSFGSK